MGPCVVLSASILTASSNKYEYNTASLNGGAVFVRTESSYQCEYCTITDNTATNGGFAYGEIGSIIGIMHSRLSKNKANENGSVIMLNTCKDESYFINNTVTENIVGYSGTLYLLESSIAINDTVMHDNIETKPGDSQTPGISGVLSTIKVYNS